MDQQGFRNLVSGRRKDPLAWVLRLLLNLPAVVYSLGVRARNFFYDKKLLKSHRADAPVVSVGNLTVGGTGKTPLVIRLANQLSSKGALCGILTRGYKTGSADAGMIDEPAVLERNCPGARVIVNPNRVAGAAEAVQSHGARVLLMDDGFQHRRLARDLDIVAIDATCPFGYGRILPAGLLREPISSLRRAHAAVITRCDQVHEEDLSRIEDRLRKHNRDLVIAWARHIPVSATNNRGEKMELGRLNDKRIFAFCGIGNPEGFFGTVRNLGCKLVGTKIFDDHYHYGHEDLDLICGEALKCGAELIVTTQKDWISCPFAAPDGVPKSDSEPRYALPFAFLGVELEFTVGRDALTSLIERVVGDTMPDRK